MKSVIYILLAICFLAACANQEDYKKVRTEVIEVHDSVMVDSELAIKNKMKLDTLLLNLDSLKKTDSAIDTAAERSAIKDLQAQLQLAETQMDDWMHSFNAETDGKSNEEAINYFKSEKQKIGSIDSLYKKVLKNSNTYLSKFEK